MSLFEGIREENAIKEKKAKIEAMMQSKSPTNQGNDEKKEDEAGNASQDAD